MRAMILVATLVVLAGCSRCSEPIFNNSNRSPAINVGVPTVSTPGAVFTVQGTSSAYVTDSNGRVELRRVEGQWTPDAGLLVIDVISSGVDGEVGSPTVHLELQLKDKAGPLSTSNLASVLLSFRDFHGEGDATMQGGNTLSAIKSLSGGRKPGDDVIMEIDFDSTKVFKGRVAARIK